MSPLTPAQRAAVVLVQLDEQRADAVLRNMSEQDATYLMQTVANLPVMSEDVVAQIIGELGEKAAALLQVRQGGRDIAARMLRDRFGAQRADEILRGFDRSVRDHPFAFLNQIDPQQIATYIAGEHPQTIAIVVAHLDNENAARLMERLGEDVRAEVARRVAKMEPIPPEMIWLLADELHTRLSAFVRGDAAQTQLGGISTVAGILNNTDRATEKQILVELERQDPEVAEAIRNEMFVFDDLLDLSDRDLQLVLRNVPVKSIALALKGKEHSVLERFQRNLSERNAQDLSEDFDTLGAQRQSLVEQAEVEIVRQARTLADSGEITIDRSDDELVA